MFQSEHVLGLDREMEEGGGGGQIVVLKLVLVQKDLEHNYSATIHVPVFKLISHYEFLNTAYPVLVDNNNM